MQLRDLVKPISELSDEELIEKLRQVKTSREVIRSAVRKRTERSEKKASRTRMTATTKLLEGLTDEERAELIRKLEDGS